MEGQERNANLAQSQAIRTPRRDSPGRSAEFVQKRTYDFHPDRVEEVTTRMVQHRRVLPHNGGDSGGSWNNWGESHPQHTLDLNPIDDSEPSDSDQQGGARQVALRDDDNVDTPRAVDREKQYDDDEHEVRMKLLRHRVLVEQIQGVLYLLFVFFVLGLAVYVILSCVWMFRNEVKLKVSEIEAAIIRESSTCAQNFVDNRCEGDILPALVQQCEEWQLCKERDPQAIARSQIQIETLVGIVNTFFSGLSVRALGFISVFLIVYFTISSLSMYLGTSFLRRPLSPKY